MDAAGSKDKAQSKPRRFSTRTIVFGVILSLMLLSTALPLRQYVAGRQALRSLEQQEARLDQHIAQLSQDKADLDTDSMVERLAREHLGMVRPGEVPFVMVPSSPAASPAGAARPG